MRLGVVAALVLCLACSIVVFGKKTVPTVSVTVNGVTMTSTTNVVVTVPQNAAAQTVTAEVSDLASVADRYTDGVLSSVWTQLGIYILAGAVLVFLFQFVKTKLGLAGNVALSIVSTACAASGVGLSSVLGGLSVENACLGAAVVVASAQLVYKLFVK